MTFRHGARPVTEEPHDERQHVSKNGSNRSWSDTSNDGKHAFPNIGRFGKMLEYRHFFDRL